MAAVIYTHKAEEDIPEKDEVHHKVILIFHSGTRTDQIILPTKRKEHTTPICKEKLSRPSREVPVGRIN